MSLLLNGGGVAQLKTIEAELNNALRAATATSRTSSRSSNTFVGGLDAAEGRDRPRHRQHRPARRRRCRAEAGQDRRGAGRAAQGPDDPRRPAPPARRDAHGPAADLGEVGTRGHPRVAGRPEANLRALSPILRQLNKAGDDLPKSYAAAADLPLPEQTRRTPSRATSPTSGRPRHQPRHHRRQPRRRHGCRTSRACRCPRCHCPPFPSLPVQVPKRAACPTVPLPTVTGVPAPTLPGRAAGLGPVRVGLGRRRLLVHALPHGRFPMITRTVRLQLAAFAAVASPSSPSSRPATSGSPTRSPAAATSSRPTSPVGRHLRRRRGDLPRRHGGQGRGAAPVRDGVVVDAGSTGAPRSPRTPTPSSRTARPWGSSTSTSSPGRSAGPYLAAGDVIPRDGTAFPLRDRPAALDVDDTVDVGATSDALVTMVDELGKAFAGGGTRPAAAHRLGDALTVPPPRRCPRPRQAHRRRPHRARHPAPRAPRTSGVFSSDFADVVRDPQGPTPTCA